MSEPGMIDGLAQSNAFVWAASGLARLTIPLFQIALHRSSYGLQGRAIGSQRLDCANHSLFAVSLALWFVYERFADPAADIRVDLLLTVPAGLLTVFLWAMFAIRSRRSAPLTPTPRGTTGR